MDDLKMIIDKIYGDYNPEKIANIPGILEKYKGKEAELLTKLSQKYNLHLEHYISIDFLKFIKGILTKYDPVNVSSASSLLASYAGREKELLSTLSDKFNTGFNDIIISIYTIVSAQQGLTLASENNTDVFQDKGTPKNKISHKKNLMIGIIGVSVVVVVAMILNISGVFRSRATNNLQNINSSQNTSSIDIPMTNNPSNNPSTTDTLNNETIVETNSKQTAIVNPYGTGNGKITIFKTCNYCPELEISIDGNFIGKLSQSFSTSSSPSCDANGTVSKILSAGRHHLSGQDNLGTSWDMMVSVPGGKCVLQEIKKDR